MKEFSFYLFIFLFINVKLKEEFGITINTKEINDTIINYIILNDEEGNNPLKFLLNPLSKFVVLFNSSTPSFRNLDSNNNENEEEDYLDLFKFKIIENDVIKSIKLNINEKMKEFKVYSIVNREIDSFFKDFDGYIGIKDKSIFAEKAEFSDKHSYKSLFNNGEGDTFEFGKEISILLGIFY